MNFLINVDGQQATFSLGNPGVNGAVTGTITHATTGGDGSFTGTLVGPALTGTVNLDGHQANVGAMISGNTIAGTISVGWFWSKNFSGTAIPVTA